MIQRVKRFKTPAVEATRDEGQDVKSAVKCVLQKVYESIASPSERGETTTGSYLGHLVLTCMVC